VTLFSDSLNGEKIFLILERINLPRSATKKNQPQLNTARMEFTLKRKALLPASWKQRNPFS